MSGGGQSSTVTQTSGPPQQVLDAYGHLVNAAQGAALQPLNYYTGPMVAGFTPQQQQAFGTVSNLQGGYIPYLNAASEEYATATKPLWQGVPKFGSDTVNQYLNPYTEDVTKSLTDLYNEQNKQGIQNIQGNATMRNAYGGDREAVAQALGVQSQQLTQAPTLANVQSTGYQGAVNEFNNQQQQQLAADQANAWLASGAGYGYGALGSMYQNLGLAGANALSSAGAQQQGLAQEQLNIPYQQFQQAQAYPYQSVGFLAPIIEGTGSLSGGKGSTTYPGPSTLSQIGGLASAGIGLYGLGQNAGWWGGGGAGDSSYYGPSTWGLDYGGGGAKRGGRIGYAGGGGIDHLPNVPGISSGVPILDLSYIPQADASGVPSNMGLHLGNVNTTTQDTSGGGGGPLGFLSSAIGLGKLVAPLFLAEGGTVGFGGDTPSDTVSSYGIGTRKVPTLDLSFMKPPAMIKGSGPPSAPSGKPPEQDQGLGSPQFTNLINSAKKVFGSDGSDHDNLAIGGVPLAATTGSVGYGMSPMSSTGQYQQLLTMPLDKLQQMAVQYPPTTEQGKLIQRAIQQKKMSLGSGTAEGQAPAQGGIGQSQQQAPAAPPQGAAGIMSQVTPTATAATDGQDYGGTSHLAAGGDVDPRGYVTADEIDPHPVVDHSGDTVKIRYPSEGKVLDLGLPAIRDDHQRRASGGPVVVPHAAWDASGGWAVSSNPSGSVSNGATANNLPVLAPPTQGSSFVAANGVTVPLMDQAKLTAVPSGTTAGGGVGDWFQPLAQYRPPGMGPTGPGGTMVFPETSAYLPQMYPVFTAFGGTPPQWAGGAAPSAGVSGGGGGSYAAPTSSMNFFGVDPSQSRYLYTPPGFSPTNSGSPYIAGEKRGGRIGYDDGGEVGLGMVPPATKLVDAAKRIQDEMARNRDPVGASGDFFTRKLNEMPLSERKNFDDGGEVGETDNALALPDDSGAGLGTLDTLAAHDAVQSGPNFGDVAAAFAPISRAEAKEATADIPREIPRGIGARPDTVVSTSGGIGEPAAPAAMVTPDRGPPSGFDANVWAAKHQIPITLTDEGLMPVDKNGQVIRNAPGFEYPKARESAPADAHPVTALAERMGAAPVGTTEAQQEVDRLVTPAQAAARSAATPEAAATSPAVDNPGALVRRYESEAAASKLGISPYNVGWGGVDLTNAPKDATGFPIWEGRPGPQGNSRAAGAYQFQPDTWRKYAVPLGIKDFSPQSQDAVFRAAYLDQGFKPWAPYNPQLAAAIRHGDGEGGPPDQLVGQQPSGEAPQVQQVKSIANDILHRTPPHERSAMAKWMDSPYFLAFLIGAGMLSSKSPFPGVALGEGLKAGAAGMMQNRAQDAKEELAQVRSQAASDANLIRAQSAQERATQNAATLQFKYDNMLRLQQAGQDSLALRQQMADTKAQLDQAKLQLQTANTQANLAKLKKPIAGYDPATGQTGSYTYDPEKNDYIFTPGATVGHAPTGEMGILQDMIRRGIATDMADAQRKRAEYKRDPNGYVKGQDFVRLVQSEEGKLQQQWNAVPTNWTKPPPNFRAQAEQAVRKMLEGTNTPVGRPAAPATPATTGAPAAPAPAAAPAAPVAPTWAKGTGRTYGGKPIYPTPQGWFYVNPDGSQGAAAQ